MVLGHGWFSLKDRLQAKSRVTRRRRKMFRNDSTLLRMQFLLSPAVVLICLILFASQSFAHMTIGNCQVPVDKSCIGNFLTT
jgi:hypothetical protein